MDRTAKLKVGDKVWTLECESSLGYKECSNCKSFGTMRLDKLIIDDTDCYNEHPGGNENTCPACKGVGKVINKERDSQWVCIEREVISIRGIIDSLDIFNMEEIICNLNVKLEDEPFEPKDCFITEEEARAVAMKRNSVILFTVDFHGCVFLFDTMTEASAWMDNFMANAMCLLDDKQVCDEDVIGPKAQSYYNKLLEESNEVGVTIKVIKMDRLDYDKVTDFGGAKILSGMPKFLDIKFGQKTFNIGDEPYNGKPNQIGFNVFFKPIPDPNKVVVEKTEEEKKRDHMYKVMDMQHSRLYGTTKLMIESMKKSGSELSESINRIREEDNEEDIQGEDE